VRRLTFFLAVVVVGLAACDSRQDSQPFFFTHVEEMRKLPKEDLLRMKEDILAKAAELPDRSVDEPPPTGTIVSRGSFGGAVEGEAVLFRGADGACVLRIENFRVDNAPDLHVVLTGDGAPVARELRGNAGSQNVSVPAGQYRTAQICSLLFQETFGEAVLRESVGAAGN